MIPVLLRTLLFCTGNHDFRSPGLDLRMIPPLTAPSATPGERQARHLRSCRTKTALT